MRDPGEQFYPVGLDQQVDDERASGLPLAVKAVTTVREERIGCQPVANRSAGAATLTRNAHDLLLEDRATELDGAPHAASTASSPIHAARSSSSARTPCVMMRVNLTSSWIAFTRSTDALRSAAASTLPISRSPCRIG